MAKPVYLYFNLRARGELPRLVAAVGDVAIEDQRITFADWPGQYKSKTPFGQIPVLSVDGKQYAQKLAISLYLARQSGLYPKSGSDLELLKYDTALQFSEEILENIVQALVDKHIHGKTETLAKLQKDTLPSKVPLLEKLLKENGTGYFVEKTLSIVDLSAYDVLEHIVDIEGKSYLDSYPLLKANFELVGKNEKLKRYVSNRPSPAPKFEF